MTFACYIVYKAIILIGLWESPLMWLHLSEPLGT